MTRCKCFNCDEIPRILCKELSKVKSIRLVIAFDTSCIISNVHTELPAATLQHAATTMKVKINILQERYLQFLGCWALVPGAMCAGSPDLLQKGVNGLPHSPGVLEFWRLRFPGMDALFALEFGFSFLKISISFSSCFAFCIHQGHQPELHTC